MLRTLRFDSHRLISRPFSIVRRELRGCDGASDLTRLKRFETCTAIRLSDLFYILTSGKDVILLPFNPSNVNQRWTLSGVTLRNRSLEDRVLEWKSGSLFSDASVFVAKRVPVNAFQSWSFPALPSAKAQLHGFVNVCMFSRCEVVCVTAWCFRSRATDIRYK